IVDDTAGGNGNIAGGWSLNITTTETIVSPADLSVDAAGDQGTINSGSGLVYTIHVANNGPATADGVVLTNTLPPGFSFDSSSTTAGSCANAGNLVTCSLGSLLAGAAVTVTISVTATQPGTATDMVTVSSATGDLNLGNNSVNIKTSVQ